MQVKINGQLQVSFEQFEETFRQAFGRDMTRDERKWLSGADFGNDVDERRNLAGQYAA